MKKNKIIQFSLLIAAIILFFFTYYSNDKDKTVEIDKDILIYYIYMSEDNSYLNNVTSRFRSPFQPDNTLSVDDNSSEETNL